MAQKRTRNKKWLWWGIGVVLVVAAVVIGVVIWQNNNGSSEKKDEVQGDNSSAVEKQETTEGKQVTEHSSDEEQAEKQKVKQYEGGDPNQAEELSGVVTYAGVNGGNLTIRVSIDQYLTEGTCELTLTRGGATIYNSIASIIGDVSAATCEGFDVPVAELGGGEIGININLKAGERRGTIRGEVGI